MLRGYLVGLCQLLRSSAYPPLVAARIAVDVLDEARTVARMYRRHAELLRCLALAEGDGPDVIEVIDGEINDPKLRGEFVTGVSLEELFGAEMWDRCGPFLIPLWASVLIMIAVTVDQWECVLLGVDPPHPDRPAEFYSGKEDVA